jgi:hypothetical protein
MKYIKHFTLFALAIALITSMTAFAQVVPPSAPTCTPTSGFTCDTWLDACGGSLFNTAVDPTNPVSVECDIYPAGAPDGYINISDFNLMASFTQPYEILVPATSTPAIASFVSPVDTSQVSGGGLLPIGTIWCSIYSATCMHVTTGGQVYYPNPNFNQ